MNQVQEEMTTLREEIVKLGLEVQKNNAERKSRISEALEQNVDIDYLEKYFEKIRYEDKDLGS